MISKQTKKGLLLMAGAFLCLCAGVALAATPTSGGIATVAQNVTANLGGVAKLFTAGSYTAGFGFAIAAIVKFKAHKDQPQQIPISQPIALLAVAVCLIFIPSVFKTTGITLFGQSGTTATISGISSFK